MPTTDVIAQHVRRLDRNERRVEAAKRLRADARHAAREADVDIEMVALARRIAASPREVRAKRLAAFAAYCRQYLPDDGRWQGFLRNPHTVRAGGAAGLGGLNWSGSSKGSGAGGLLRSSS